MIATLTNAITDLAGNAIASNTWLWYVPRWASVGGVVSSVSETLPRPYSVKLNSTGEPAVAFTDYYGVADQRVYVRHMISSLALDSAGKQVVTFREVEETHANVYTERWTGAAWQVVGGAVNAVAGQDVAIEPRLALDSAGRPVVFFSEYDGTRVNGYVWRSNQ